MTFGEIKQALYDRIGLVGVTPLAGTVTKVERVANEALQKVAANVNWEGLRNVWNVTFDVSGITALDATVRKVESIANAQGVVLDEKSPDAFEDFYRGDLTAGAHPLVFCVDGFDSSLDKLRISTWPVLSGGSTGKVRGFRRPAKLTSDSAVPELPSELHHLIVDEGVARYRELEESGNWPSVAQVAAQGVGQAARPG